LVEPDPDELHVPLLDVGPHVTGEAQAGQPLALYASKIFVMLAMAPVRPLLTCV